MGLRSVGADTQQKDSWPEMQTLARPSLKKILANLPAAGVSAGVVNPTGIYIASLCNIIANIAASAIKHMHACTSGDVRVNTDRLTFCPLFD